MVRSLPSRARRLAGVAAVVVACAPLYALTAQPAPAPTTVPTDVDQLVRTQMAEAQLVGVGAAVLVNGRIAWVHAWGHRDVERSQPFTTHTPMKLASVTKPFVGVLLMQAVRAGRLSLDEDINRYLPFRVVNPHHPTARITLRHLATHTSGITDRLEVFRDSYRWGDASVPDLEAFLRDYVTPGAPLYHRDNFLDALPGTRRDYCNFCAGLAGLIVERALGGRLDVLLAERVFAPLGMHDSRLPLEDTRLDAPSTHFVVSHGLAVPILPYRGITYPDGGVYSSVADLSRFFSAMLRDGAFDGARILDAADAREMQRFQFTAQSHPENFPLSEGNSGLFWRTKRNGALVGHGGNDPGVFVDMLSSPDRRVAVILMTNTSVAPEDMGPVLKIWDALWADATARAQRDAMKD
jgi:CubicO group peptidase (beta-lactamase class C family)